MVETMKCKECGKDIKNPKHIVQGKWYIGPKGAFNGKSTACCDECWAKAEKWVEEYKRKEMERQDKMVAEIKERMAKR